MLTPHLDDGDVRLYHGDCVEVMARMDAESVDAVVCDPPYELGFMGREWDRSGVAYRVETWREALRVLKPGGHLLAFGGTRTYHRLTCAIEDAGFEVRDCLSWLYGSGFPKSLDVSKAIDKAAGAEREVIGVRQYPTQPNGRSGVHRAQGYAPGEMSGTEVANYVTAPATPDAARWQGWGTALKPAWEPVVVARKPLVGTVAGNVLAYGTGALNIDGCRIGTDEDTSRARYLVGDTAAPFPKGAAMGGNGSPLGRWPANVALDQEAAALLDAQSGSLPGGTPRYAKGDKPLYGGTLKNISHDGFGDQGGGASRFFYTAKASRADRGDGNTHPTVKPTDLMRWLIRLVTPPGGLILDPFAGSGTTGVAARAEGVRCILIEREDEYLPIIAGRLSQLSLLGDAC